MSVTSLNFQIIPELKVTNPQGATYKDTAVSDAAAVVTIATGLMSVCL